MKFFRTTTLAIAALLASMSHADVRTATDANDVILAGYDAVAYFTQGKPVVGSPKYTAVYNGAIYRFSSSKNRELFRADPARYAPQYGGFCAFGMTFGKKFEVNGKAWEIVDGKLYVNKDEQVYKAWAKNIPQHIDEADAAWPRVEYLSVAEL